MDRRNQWADGKLRAAGANLRAITALYGGTGLALPEPMTSMIVAALLCAEPAGLAAIAPADQPTINIFSSPVSSVGMLGTAILPGFPSWVYVPLGVTVELGSNWGVTAEVSGAYSVPRSYTREGWAFSASAGPTFFLSGRGMDGFFVSPKFTFQIAHPASQIVLFDSSDGGPIDVGPGVSRSFLLGADVGYQLRWGHLTLGFLLGASAGYSFDQPNGGLTTPFGISSGFGASQRTQSYAYALNLNFLRLGYAF